MNSKIFLAGAAAAMSLASGIAVAATAATPAAVSPVTGTYFEARTANVFVGACHYGGEVGSIGRQAVMAWHVASGVRNDVSLAGLNVMAAVVGDRNLDEKTAARSSVLFIDSRASQAQANALAGLARELGGAALGQVRASHTTAIQFTAAGDDFSVAVPGSIKVKASLLPDRACCNMPYQVWYKPLAPVEHPIVGKAVENSCTSADLNANWSYPDQNSAFVGAFTVRG